MRMQQLEEAFERLAETKPAIRILSAEQAEKAEPYAEWPSLPSRIKPLAFPMEAFPDAARDMVQAVAESVQVSADMPACLVLGAANASIVGRGKVSIKSDYAEQLLLYIAVSADPSERKSAAMRPIFAPIYAFEKAERECMKEQVRDAKAKARVLEKQRFKAENNGDVNRAIELSKDIEQLEEIREFELLKSEGTPEAIAQCMARNGGRIAIASPEGEILGILAGGYTSGASVNMGVLLKAFDGDPVNSERVSRKGDNIDHAYCSITLTVQPTVLEKLTESDAMTGNGLASRFLYSAPASMVGERKADSESIPLQVIREYEHCIQNILSMNDVVLTLCSEAEAIRREWFDIIEKKQTPGGELNGLGNGWAGKIVGITVRIAGLLALLEGQQKTISSHHMCNAVLIGNYFVSHAKHVFQADSIFSCEATAIFRYLNEWGKAEYKPSDLRQALRKRRMFKDKRVIDQALRELIEAGMIREIYHHELERKGRPPEAMHQVNPEMLEKGALDENFYINR